MAPQIPPAPHMVVGLCVVALHAALYLLLRDSTNGPGRQHVGRPPSPTSVRLLPFRAGAEAPNVAPAAAKARPPENPRQRPAAPPVAALRAPGRPEAPATAAPPFAELPGSASVPTPALPALPASQPPRPLDLTVPRGFDTRGVARQPALDDPRANTARLTPEQRMARALDTRVVEESMEDGRRRFRQGASCVIVTPSRMAQLQPFDDAAARTPSTVSACP